MRQNCLPFPKKSLFTLSAFLLVFSTPWSAKAIDKVVYGSDNRVDVQDSPNPSYREWARSTAAMIENERLVPTSDGLMTQIKAEINPMRICSDGPFSQQYMVANCTGFLLGPDILVTAGHCIQGESSCADYKWVFDFKQGGLGHGEYPQVSTQNVYSCKEIIGRALDQDTKMDYAVIRLNREVKDRNYLTYRHTGKPALGDEMVVIGHPSGLPSKIADGAKVRDNGEESFFVVNADTFQGNSGSPVINSTTGNVEGILVRGDSDYVYDNDRRCMAVHHCAEDSCRGEDVTRIDKIPELLSPIKPEEVPTPSDDNSGDEELAANSTHHHRHSFLRAIGIRRH